MSLTMFSGIAFLLVPGVSTGRYARLWRAKRRVDTERFLSGTPEACLPTAVPTRLFASLCDI